METLPPEILCMIAEYLKGIDILTFRLLNTQCRFLIPLVKVEKEYTQIFKNLEMKEKITDTFISYKNSHPPFIYFYENYLFDQLEKINFQITDLSIGFKKYQLVQYFFSIPVIGLINYYMGFLCEDNKSIIEDLHEEGECPMKNDVLGMWYKKKFYSCNA